MFMELGGRGAPTRYCRLKRIATPSCVGLAMRVPVIELGVYEGDCFAKLAMRVVLRGVTVVA